MTTYSKPTRERDSDEIAVQYQSELGITEEYESSSIWYIPLEELSLGWLESKVSGELNFSKISVGSNPEKTDRGIELHVIPKKSGFKYIEGGWNKECRGIWHETISRKQAEELVNKIKETYQAAIA